MTTTSLLDRARGRWKGILQAIGLEGRYLTGKNGPCPFCDGKDRWRWTNYQDDGRWICNACGKGSGIDLVMRWKKCDFKTAAQLIEVHIGAAPVEEKPKVDLAEVRDEMSVMWKASRPITAQCPPGRHLMRRGLSPTMSPVLRWYSDVPWALMLAKVISPDGKAVNLHRTFLDANGQKAPIDKPRLLMPHPTPIGSCARLMAIGEDGRLGIAEGIETALSAAVIFGIACWATISAASMEGFIPPPRVTELVIFGDHDKKFGGQKAAYAVAHKLACQRDAISVSVEIPPIAGEDWNDVLMRITPAGYRILGTGGEFGDLLAKPGYIRIDPPANGPPLIARSLQKVAA